MDSWIILHYLLYALEITGFFMIGLVAIFRNRSAINTSFATFSFLVAAWQFVQLSSQLASVDRTAAVALLHLSVAIAGPMIASFLVFALTYTGNRPNYLRYYGLGCIVGALTLFSGSLSEVSITYSGIGIPRLDFWYGSLIVLGGLSLFAGVLTIARRAFEAREPQQRQRDIIVILNMSIVGTFVFLASFYTSNFSDGVLAQHIIPTAVLIGMLSFVYALTKGLLDIRFAAVRTIAYVLALVTLSFIYYITAYVVSITLFQGETSTSLSVSPANIFLALLLAFIFQPIKKFFDRITDNIFYRDTYKSEDFFSDLSELLASSTDLRGLLERASIKIAQTLKVEQVFFFVYYSNGVNHHMSAGTPRHSRIPLADAEVLDQYHKDYGQVILTETLPENAKIRPVLISHKIELLMPLTSGGRIVGYVCLGDHRNGNYTKRDLKVLSTVADELVIAIQNALSVHEIKEINATLQQRIDVATKELRESNAQLQRLDIAKDEFVSMASHQLRTPLTSVKGYISMLLDGDAGKLTETQQKLLSEAFKSSERMVGLISDFLSVSRVQTGRFVIEIRETDLSQLVKQEVDSLRDMARSHDLSLTLDIPKEPVMVQLDEEKIRQIVMNFIDNAVYYSHAGGKITVALESKEKNAVLKVTDVGIGVPEKEQAKLFSKFYRASNARKQRPDGTGVGLYLAKKVISGHRGKLVFSSEEGRGSTFGFSLPLVLEDEIDKPSDDNTKPRDNTAHN